MEAAPRSGDYLGPVVARFRAGDAPMRRDEVLGILRAHKAEIVERFVSERRPKRLRS